MRNDDSYFWLPVITNDKVITGNKKKIDSTDISKPKWTIFGDWVAKRHRGHKG